MLSTGAGELDKLLQGVTKHIRFSGSTLRGPCMLILNPQVE